MTHTFHIFYDMQMIPPNTTQNSVFKYNDLSCTICCVVFLIILNNTTITGLNHIKSDKILLI